jgi:hypothetical protein
MMLRRSPEIRAGLFVTGQGVHRRNEKRDDADAIYLDRLFSIVFTKELVMRHKKV